MAIEEVEYRPLGKKHDWTERKGLGYTYELIVWEAGKKIDRFVFNTKSKFKEILELIRLKFGMDYN